MMLRVETSTFEEFFAADPGRDADLRAVERRSGTADEAGGAVSSTRVLVAGASIAGPALAHWLRRRGAEVTVVERAPELRPGGQAVDARAGWPRRSSG
jgi:2-polyprenyl-6-methoxyphenol hydroxylase and related FAD-dependent oxidoreductases